MKCKYTPRSRDSVVFQDYALFEGFNDSYRYLINKRPAKAPLSDMHDINFILVSKKSYR